jgi:hypothetical protein
MNFFQLVASTTKRRAIVSDRITDPFQVPPFARGDSINGSIIALSETGDPTAPTAPFPLTACLGIALTNGKDVTYAIASGLGVVNNVINFTLDVEGVELDALLTTVEGDWIDAFLEVRVSVDAQDGLLLREPITIQSAATAAAVLTGAGGTLNLNEVPTGAIDGSNILFVTVDRFRELAVYLNGMRQTLDTDYQIVSPTSFTMTIPPIAGDILTVDYIPTSIT